MPDKSKKLLLVEDDQFLSSLLKNRLQKEGVEVEYAKDGEDAIKKIREAVFSLVLMDIILPKKSGFEILEEIRTDPVLQHKELPIIIISNLGQPEDVKRGLELGAVEYFVKARTSIDDLVTKIKQFIEEA